MSALTYASLFAGVEGFGLGFTRAGMTGRWTAEKDDRCRALLERKFPQMRHYDDVRKVDGRAERVDLVCGGFPCQDVSVAGRRAGLAGERSGLWFEFRRVLDELRPSWCVVENVPGLLSSNGGRDMGTVLGGLGDLGYGFAYRVLDAQWIGLAQRRKRLFIVGCLGDAAGAVEVLLEPEGGGGDHPPSREAGPIASALTSHGVGTCGADDNQAQAHHLIAFHQTQDPISERELSPAIGATSIGMGVAYRKVRRAQTSDDDETWDVADVANTLNAFDVGDTRTTHAVLDDIAVRRLTPLECERLQGFPDDWTAGQPDSTRYKQMGNAVAVNVSEWIGRRIVAAAEARVAA